MVILVVISSIYIYTSGPVLSDEAEAIIYQVIDSDPPEIVSGMTAFANSNGVRIWYEDILPKGEIKGSILLIMGISNDALSWPQDFINAFTDAGYQVIRFDHRGTGMSDWLDDWDSENPYSLTDMANDGVAILDDLDIDKAHLIGVSLGGMIAQELTINHPERVSSLTSMMSSGYIEDPELPPISIKTTLELVKTILKYSFINSEANLIKMRLAARIILRGTADYELDYQQIAERVLYNTRKRQGFNQESLKQHQLAVHSSGSRYEKLMTLNTPTLIIHSKSDPLIPFEHGKKCFEFIPNADSLWLDDIGHDIPKVAIPTVCNKIISLIEAS